MRITGLHVDGFGLLHDQCVEGFPAGTIVVLGPNEAGKSTLHAFLVRTLFGHPRSNDAAGRERHEPLRGGRHGGTVHCRDGDGGRWEVHRYTEGSPRLRVVTPDGREETGEDAVLPLLGRTVDDTRYEQVFAIDLDDLAGVGSLGDGALDDLLFDAATVGTGRSLRAARDEALDRRDALWTPTATTRPLPAALDRRREARAALTAARDAAHDALDTRRRLDAVALKVEELARRQRDVRARAALLERVLDAWPSWHRAAQLADELAARPEADAVAPTQVDEALVAAADRIEALAQGLGAHDLAGEQLAVAERDVDAVAREVTASLTELGDGWTEERVRAVPVATEVHQRLELAGDRLLDARLQRESARERAAEAKRQATRRADAADARAARVPDAPPEDEVVAAEQAVAVLRTGVPALTGTGSTRGAVAPRLGRARRLLPVVLLVVALALVVGATVLGLPPGVAGGVVVAGVVAVCGYLLGRSTAPSATAAGTAAPPALGRDVADAAATLGLPSPPSLAQVEAAAGRAAAARAVRREAQEAALWEAELRTEAADAHRTARQARSLLDDRNERLRRARQRWTQLCDEVGLDAEAPVRVTLAVHERVRRTVRLLGERDSASEAVDRLRPRVEDYRDRVTALVADVGLEAAGQDAVRLLPGLRDRARTARSAREGRARRRSALEQEQAAAEVAVEQLLGSGPRGARARELLDDADPGGWQEELAEVQRTQDELTAARDEALAERTRLEGELRRLGGDDAVPRAEQALAAVRVEVAELAERWAVADTAARLLEETVARFEREQQPRVLLRASELFARATGGRWAELRRLEGQVVVARSAGGPPVPAGVLSRGTREQLWLCLRLALAEDLARDRPLPLLVDDLLGTSDPERSRHVAEVLAEVARGQQVWLFTCHPATADLVTSTDPTAAVLRLDHGGRVAGLDLQAHAGADQLRLEP